MGGSSPKKKKPDFLAPPPDLTDEIVQQRRRAELLRGQTGRTRQSTLLSPLGTSAPRMGGTMLGAGPVAPPVAPRLGSY